MLMIKVALFGVLTSYLELNYKILRNHSYKPKIGPMSVVQSHEKLVLYTSKPIRF